MSNNRDVGNGDGGVEPMITMNDSSSSQQQSTASTTLPHSAASATTGTVTASAPVVGVATASHASMPVSQSPPNPLATTSTRSASSVSGAQRRRRVPGGRHQHPACASSGAPIGVQSVQPLLRGGQGQGDGG